MENIRLILELLYYLSGIILGGGVIFAILQIKQGILQLDLLKQQLVIGVEELNLLKKDNEDRYKRAAVEKSIEYLKLYAERIIPASDLYNRKLKEEIPDPTDTSHLFDGKFNLNFETLDQLIKIEIIVKQKSGAIQLLNELEFFCAAINAGLTDEDLVFTPTAKNFCKLIKRDHLVISVMRNRGTPYKNLLEVFNKWSARLEIEEDQLQIQEATNRIKEKEHVSKFKPPIGLERSS